MQEGAGGDKSQCLEFSDPNSNEKFSMDRIRENRVTTKEELM